MSAAIGERVVIYQSGARGIYVADFHHHGHRTLSLKTTSKSIAVRKAKLIDAELLNGAFTLGSSIQPVPTPSRKHLHEAIDEYIAFHRTEGNRHRTVRRYQGILNTFLEFAAQKGVLHVGEVNMVLIDAYRAHRAKSLRPRSMHNEARLLKSFLSWCEEREFIERSPLYKRKFRRPKPQARKAPSLAQVNAVLNKAAKIRVAQFALLAFTGARAGECRNLRVGDVDFNGNWIHIRSRPGFETKNREDRKVPMHARLRTILQALPRRRSGWFFLALPSNRYPKGDHRINTKRLNEDFQRVLKKLGMPVGRDDGFTVHSLRRFFRTTCVNAGIPERVVDLWIGVTATPSRWGPFTTI